MIKLLTFLGNTEYKNGIYTYEGRKAAESRFVQTAIYELFCQDFTPEDQIFIFLTKEAESKNWSDSISREGEELEGMKNAWKKIDSELLQQNQIKKVRISSHQDEKHNWDLFEKILDNIDEGDEIIFDITYGFRSLPILALITLNYARVLKKASLKRLLYGCWEMKDESTPPTVPIIDMTEMIPLLDWAHGVKSYQETGNASVIQSLTKEEADSLKSGVTHEEADVLKTLANDSHGFHQMMQTCRAPEIPQGLNNLRSSLNQAKTIRGFRPFEKLFGKMEAKIEGFTDRPILDDYQAAKWCFENGLIQQGYTMLQEGIISAVCRVMGDDLSVYNTRNKIKNWLKGNPPKKLLKKIPNINLLIDNKDQLSFKKLNDYRNSMNHAGWNENDISHKEFHIKLDEFLQFFRPFFEAMDQLYQDRREGVTTR